MPYHRPAAGRGRVWRQFKGRSLDGAPPLSYRIQDLPESDTEDCLDLMQETFLRDEPLCQTLGVTSDPTSILTIRSNWASYLQRGVSLACYAEHEGRDVLVAFNICLVNCIDDLPEEPGPGESWNKLLKTLMLAEQTCDVYQHYGVDKFLTSSGLTVLPEHRGQNIGAQMFQAREPLCKALGIEATATVFTAVPSQVLAAKCGYELLGELPYSDMLQYGVDLTRCPTPSAKFMGIRFQ